MIKNAVLIILFLLQAAMLHAAAHPDVSIKKKTLYALSKESRVKALFKAIDREDSVTFHYLIKTYPELAKETDHDGNPPLIKVLEHDDYRKRFWKEAIPMLVAAGGDMNSSDVLQRWTPLLRAVYNKNVPLELIEFLVQNGASINESRDQETPFMYAARNGRADIIMYLIEHKVDPTLKDRFGRTAASWARIKDHHSLADYIKGYESKYNCDRRTYS